MSVLETFQTRVRPWMIACFGEEVSNDRLERGDRLLEEVLELLQSGEYPKDRVASLAGYVWSRPLGEPAQEVGGVMVTLAAYCLAHDLNMHEAAETELARIWTKVKTIRAKQAAKPKGSALPQVWPDPAALADSPEVQKLIREAEARIVDRYEMAIRRRFFGVKGFAWSVRNARDEAITAIRAEAAAIKGDTP